MTFSADGTSHHNINYSSCHVNLKVDLDDYNDPHRAKKQATYFFGIMASLDGTSKQSLKDWDNTLDTITDLYNRSPLGNVMEVFFTQLICLPSFLACLQTIVPRKKRMLQNWKRGR